MMYDKEKEFALQLSTKEKEMSDKMSMKEKELKEMLMKEKEKDLELLEKTKDLQYMSQEALKAKGLMNGRGGVRILLTKDQ